MNLAENTKELVNQGVFSLYLLSQGAARQAKAEYILYTTQHSFLLSREGDIVQELSRDAKFATEQAISFPELALRNVANYSTFKLAR